MSPLKTDDDGGHPNSKCEQVQMRRRTSAGGGPGLDADLCTATITEMISQRRGAVQQRLHEVSAEDTAPRLSRQPGQAYSSLVLLIDRWLASGVVPRLRHSRPIGEQHHQP